MEDVHTEGTTGRADAWGAVHVGSAGLTNVWRGRRGGAAGGAGGSRAHIPANGWVGAAGNRRSGGKVVVEKAEAVLGAGPASSRVWHRAHVGGPGACAACIGAERVDGRCNAAGCGGQVAWSVAV